MRHSSGCASESAAGHHPRRRRELRRRRLHRLFHPDLHPCPALLDSADAVLPVAARDRRLRAPGRRSVPEPLPPRHPAPRRRRHGDRHQPNPRDRDPVHRRAGGRIADSRLRPSAGLLVPALAATGVVVALDQGTKGLATSLVSRGDRIEVLPFLHLENVRNEGVAFGIGGDISAVFIGATIVVLLGFLVFLAFRGGSGWLVWLPAALLIGGALGNLADRVRDGAVTDFINVPLWPTFNLADVAIVVGVLLLLFDVERSEGRGRDS